MDMSRMPISPQVLEDQVHEWAKTSEKVLLVKHAEERQDERRISSREIFEVLRKGKISEEPYQDSYGDWRIRMHHVVAGRRIDIAVAVKKDKLAVITVMGKEKS